MAEWIAYENIRGPLGPQREDLLHAHLIRNLWAIAIPGEARNLHTANYLLFERLDDPAPARQSESTQMAIARGLSAAIAAQRTAR